MASAFLKVVAGGRQGLNVPLPADGPLVIGRKRGDLLIDDPLVSSTHAQILPKDDGWIIQDLGSTNGTLVDGRLVRELALRPGAEISIGNSRLVLFVGANEAPAAEPALSPADRPSQVEIAWLLDEELVELQGSPDRTRTPADVVDQDLRLPPGMHAVLECVAGTDAGKVFRFTRGNVTVGRKTGEIPLSVVEVSRRHAVIEVFGREMIFLRDLGSTNGTYHNGRKVDVARLRAGDTVGIGRSVLKLQVTR
jgi:pSer/pThr/pTyr-binding forkhead associated (FHA) protein